MRVTDPIFRPRMWSAGDADGTWHCGLCLLKSLEAEHVFVNHPTEALARVKAHNLTVPDDPGVAPVVDPINRTLLSAPAGATISVDMELDMLLIDPEKHSSFDPIRAKHRLPDKLTDNRFGSHKDARRIRVVCDGCGVVSYVTLNNHSLPPGAYMVRQH